MSAARSKVAAARERSESKVLRELRDESVARKFASLPDAHSFADATREFPEGGGSQSITLEIPRIAGMRELRIEGALARLVGVPTELPEVVRAHPSSSNECTLALAKKSDGAALRSVRVEGLAPAIGAAGASLIGSGAVWNWSQAQNGTTQFASGSSALGDADHLHWLVRGASGPPVAAAPSFALPDKSGQYRVSLAGATLKLGTPSASDLTLEFRPPLASSSATLLLGAITKSQRDDARNLPNEAAPATWSAKNVAARFTSVPSALSVTLEAGGKSAALADFPGALSEQATQLDFGPASRALVADAYKAGGAGAIAAKLTLSSKSAGGCSLSSVQLAARYLFDAVGEDGATLEVRGGDETLELDLASGLRPERARCSLSGRFGRGVLTKSSDRPKPPTRVGLRLEGDACCARRLVLVGDERELPLLRVGIFARASQATEVLVEFHRDEGGTIGAPIGEPASIPLEPDSEANWRRAELEPKSWPRQALDAVWIVLRTSRGIAWCYADELDAEGDDSSARRSSDGGATWERCSLRPRVQLHVESPVVRPAPIEVASPFGRITSDLLATRAARSITADSGEPSEPESFRKEALDLFAARDLARLAELGDSLALRFFCERDVDLTLRTFELEYDPWRAAS